MALKMSEPLYSIVIPTFNRAHLIEQTLYSVLNQTYLNWECIVVDDGSTDNTSNLMKHHIQKDLRLSYLDRPQHLLSGGNAARNFGLKHCKGNYVIFLDSDDLLKADCLTIRNKCLFEANYNFDMLVSHTGTFKTQIGDSDLLWNSIVVNSSYDGIIKRFFNLDMPWHTNGVTWSKSFINAIGKWDETLISWQDWELHSRAMFHKPKILYNIEQVDNYFRNDIKHVSIGTKYKSKLYLLSIEKAIKSVSKLVSRLDTVEQAVLRPDLIKLSHKMLIAFPIENNRFYDPIKILFKLVGSKLINFRDFAWVYLVLISSRRSKLKKYLFMKYILNVQKRLVLSSTYLQLKESSLFNQSNNGL
jgi:glycosyltransferase involved in cell wall biosynthesis